MAHKKEKALVPVSIRLEPEIKEKLEQLVNPIHSNKSEYIREVISNLVITLTN